MRSCYDVMHSMYERLLENLQKLSQTDPELSGRFGAAFSKGLRMMADGLDKEAAA